MNVSVLSLLVAALAVFVGPTLSYWGTKRQIESSLEIANKQVIGPMRQAWINNLRDLLAELNSRTVHYYTAGYENRSDAEYRALELLEFKIRLMLNPYEEDHARLEKLIKTMTSELSRTGDHENRDFEDAQIEVMKLSREILKREWEVVKGQSFLTDERV